MARIRTEAPPERIIEVKESRQIRDLAFIPQEVVDFFEVRGERATLASGLSQNITAMAAHERFAVEMDAFGGRQEEFKGILKRNGFTFKDGYAWKGDCILYAQGHEARDNQLAEGFQNFLDSEVDDEDEAARLNELLSQSDETRKGRVRVFQGNQ